MRGRISILAGITADDNFFGPGGVTARVRQQLGRFGFVWKSHTLKPRPLPLAELHRRVGQRQNALSCDESPGYDSAITRFFESE